MTTPVVHHPAPLEAPRRRGVASRAGIGLALSLLAHALLLASLWREVTLPGVEAGSRPPLTVALGPPAPQPAAVPPAEAKPPPPTAPPRPRAKPTPRIKPSPTPAPELAPAPTPAPVPVTRPTDAAPADDLSAMINAARERRRATEPAEPAAPLATGNELALQNIERSVQRGRGRDGANGVFQILDKGPRTARFRFRGWTVESRKQWNQVIEVDAGPGGDVERAIVRKMIELIRQHHNADFSWDSHRLGRIVPLSARQQDNAGLEDFLMREFFGGR